MKTTSIKLLRLLMLPILVLALQAARMNAQDTKVCQLFNFSETQYGNPATTGEIFAGCGQIWEELNLDDYADMLGTDQLQNIDIILHSYAIPGKAGGNVATNNYLFFHFGDDTFDHPWNYEYLIDTREHDMSPASANTSVHLTISNLQKVSGGWTATLQTDSFFADYCGEKSSFPQ